MRYLFLCPLAAILSFFVACTAGPTIAAESISIAPDFSDAELTSLVFIDPDRGWAVGDRGAIWRTSDGGRSWLPHLIPSSARWNSVQFIDERHGWIAGGSYRPFTNESLAAALFTTDGGETWKPSSVATLPAFHATRFLDGRRGWAAAEPSPMYAAGLFRTDNGGRTWTGLPSFQGAAWQSLALRESGGGMVVSLQGETAMLLSPTARRMPTIDVGLRGIRKLKLAGQQDGWLVGDGGLVQRTRDAGLSWQAVTSLPREASLFDFHDVTIRGPRIWIVGSPGTKVFHSPDGGETWRSDVTGVPTPLHAVTFLDEQRGWAAGALGTILATRDGGRTWSRQRGGGTRAAVLGVFHELETVPWEVLAQVCGNDGYLGAVELLVRRDMESPAARETSAERRAQAALAAVGVSSASRAWRFPLRQPGLAIPADQIFAGWDQLHTEGGFAALEAHLVQKIRQWRPDVILADESTAPAKTDRTKSMPDVIQTVLTNAISKAEDDRAYPAQIEAAGLSTWRVKKLLFVGQRDTSSAVVFNTSQLATRLGKSLSAVASWSRGVALEDHWLVPAEYWARTALNRIPQDNGRRDVMSGVILSTGGDARRQLPAATNMELRELTKAAQQQRTLQTLFTKVSGDEQQTVAWLGQLNDLLHGMSKPVAADLLFQLAQRYHSTGKTDLAIDTLKTLVEKFPDEELSAAANVWLVRLLTSGELARRAPRMTQLSANGAVSLHPIGDKPQVRSVVPASASEAIESATPKRTSDVASAVTTRPREPWDAKALMFASTLEKSRPVLAASPAVKLAQVAAHRRFARKKEAEQMLTTMASRNDAWGECAQAELALLGGKAPTRPRGVCAATGARPKLDGKLDEPLWQRAKPLELKSEFQDDDTWTASVQLARDDEFLYLAARCRKTPGVGYATSNAARTHDADLSQRDRIEFFLDVDRDYASFFHLSIDHRGWVAESCVGDASWNPTWYVAADADDTEWRIEAAIAWTEFAAGPPTARDTWAVGVQRIVPEAGFQSWTRPAAIRPRPEGFGLLMFE